jgi:putative addiction module component (TIGR02574 family)
VALASRSVLHTGAFWLARVCRRGAGGAVFESVRLQQYSAQGTNLPDFVSVTPMSSTALQRALDLGLELPENERTALVHDLIAGLDGPADTGAEQAWEAEITKRLDELEAGNARTSDADEAPRKIDDRLRRR